MENTQTRKVLVTGGNSGIGYALCKQLILENKCYVYMGTRSQERGQKAVDEMPEGCKGNIEVLLVDVADEASVKSAAATLKEKLGDEKLYALVNNAGVGLSHKGVTKEQIVTTNAYGPRWMTENFVGMIDSNAGRIVNVGSAAGPMYAGKMSEDDQKAFWNNPDVTWEQLDAKMQAILPDLNDMMSYAMSKAAVAIYAAIQAKQYPKLKCSAISPGLVDTAIVANFTQDKVTPEQGTVSIRHCLFNELKGNGWFWGSDALRSPLLKGRQPGDPEYDGN